VAPVRDGGRRGALGPPPCLRRAGPAGACFGFDGG
jgi:hypothetical protein